MFCSELSKFYIPLMASSTTSHLLQSQVFLWTQCDFRFVPIQIEMLSKSKKYNINLWRCENHPSPFTFNIIVTYFFWLEDWCMSVHAVKIFRSKELKLSLIAQSIAGDDAYSVGWHDSWYWKRRKDVNFTNNSFKTCFCWIIFQKQIPMLRGNKIGWDNLNQIESLQWK